MIKKNIKTKKGATILETVFYIVLLLVISITVINAMIIMTKSFKETKIGREVIQSGEIMEKISREIKQAYQINSLENQNTLILNTKDEAGNEKLVEFAFSGENITLLENGSLIGNLNNSNIIVENLTFNQITTTEGKAIKVVLTVRSKNDNRNRNYDFYNTVVLRRNY
ncbi:MAG TPA: hypothetical protein PKZ36_01475 [Candidatus Paceibacterota bacterium]|nr:hypothetical protein [Candidatus Paceibacterota bacterium]HPT18057.1 hypothetical protein [Candidatus Paceibacterota bacterium]